MWKNKITFWFFPETTGSSQKISVPKAWLYLVPIGMLLLVMTSLFLLSELLGDRVSQEELTKLRVENQQLGEKFEKLRWSLAEAGSRFNDLVQKEIAIRSIFNLPAINSEERELGTGGPAPVGFAALTETEQTAYATEAEVDRLLKLSQFEMQRFDEVETKLASLRDLLDHTPSIAPTKGWFSRGFGMHYDPFTGYKQMHKGVDLANSVGTAIVAPATGRVLFAGYDGSGLGNMIMIDHGSGIVTRYGHLSKILVRVGQVLKRGDLIAKMGSTGYSTGSHLHYEVWRGGKPVDPSDFILNDR